ncbi:mammalian ependymin-related protein 1-like isoform X2 [Antedon mediterranea]|uniref:mammalian ependymin-related protein 1-like isoform X2 n=1 Tax=Antedon mediterranea TaxID=105859 RepID=UPI003AF53024
MTAYLALCLLFLAITVKSDPTRCDAPSMEALVVEETLQAFRLDLDTKHCSTKEISKEPRPLFGIPEHAKFGGESIHRDSGMYRESGILVNKWWANTERSHYIGFWTQDCLPVYETYEYTRIVYSYVELGIWDPNVFVPPLEKCFFP